MKTAHISECEPFATNGNSLDRSSRPSTAAFLQWNAGATSVEKNVKTPHISECEPLAMKGNSIGRSSLPTTAAFLQWYAGATSKRLC